MEIDSKLLAGRTAMVTGASRGIGRYIAQRLAAAGATVVAVARSMDQSVARERYTPERIMPGTLTETVALIEAAGGKAIALGCDLLDPAQRNSLIMRAADAAGPIDILINNAGFCVFAPIEEMSASVFDQTFDQYVRVPFALSKAAIPSMKARGAGWIVNISSTNALAPRRPFTNKMRSAGSTAYSAAKAALNRLTQGLAEEVVGYNIAVNAVAPSTAILSPGAAELTPAGYATEDPAYMAATVLAMCHRPAAERTGLIAYSMHYAHDEKIPVTSLDGTTRLPDLPAPPHSHPRIEAAGSGRAFG
jgi:3-oxoacyl-[acyl-carrier protein] reductase